MLSDLEGSHPWHVGLLLHVADGGTGWLACLPWPWGVESRAGTVPPLQSSAHSLSTTEAGPAPRSLPPLGTAASLSGTRGGSELAVPPRQVAVTLRMGVPSTAVPTPLR